MRDEYPMAQLVAIVVTILCGAIIIATVWPDEPATVRARANVRASVGRPPWDAVVRPRMGPAIDPWIVLRAVDVRRLVTASSIAAVTNRYQFHFDGSQAPPGVRVYFDDGEWTDTAQTHAEYVARIERETGEPAWRSWIWVTERPEDDTGECYYSGMAWMVDRANAHYVYADPLTDGSVLEVRMTRPGPPPAVEDMPIKTCETIQEIQGQAREGWFGGSWYGS